MPRLAIVAAGSALIAALLVVTTSGPAPDWRTDASEPYPFTTPVPPLSVTPLDGAYDREPTENYPDRPGCTRCQPYPLDGGRSVLTLDRGRYLLDQQRPRYQDAGHYVVTGDQVTFYNSPECGSVRGVYRWRLSGGQLVLTRLDDACGFGQRARDLTERVWQALAPAEATTTGRSGSDAGTVLSARRAAR